MTARRAAAVAAVVLFAALGLCIWLTTPWHPLGFVPPADRVAPDATRDFTAAEIARDQAFHAAVHPPAYLSLALGLVVAAVLAATPLGARLVSGSARLVGRGWVRQAALGALAVVLIGRLVTVPFDAWAESVERQHGLSTQPWGSWAADQAKGYAVTVAVTVPVLLIVLALARRLPRWWWAPFAVVGGLLVVGASYAYPIVVEPLFSSFHPLPAGPLRRDLFALADRAGVPVSQVLVSDASTRTTALNAYVSGFGGSRRIVLYDTLLSQPRKEIEVTVAHELGHAKYDDVLHGTIEGALAFAAGVCLLYLVVTSRRVLRAAGASAPGDPRAAALLIGLVAWATFLGSPVQDLVSRHIEARADVHALNLTRDPATMIRLQRDLALRGLNTLEPSWPVYALFFDHPSAPQRIAIAREWARMHGVELPR